MWELTGWGTPQRPPRWEAKIGESGAVVPLARLVEAKMDQVRGVAVVTRVNHRVFGDDQWKELKTKLASWRENLEAVANMTVPQIEA